MLCCCFGYRAVGRDGSSTHSPRLKNMGRYIPENVPIVSVDNVSPSTKILSGNVC